MESHRPPAEAHAKHGRRRAEEKLKSVVMKWCAMAKISSSSSSSTRALMEKRIHELVHTHTPHHPPYAWMIENAIKELNEEGGWDEAAISKFILEEYKDLPWAHPAFLNHHLKRLSKTGNLTHNHDKLRITCSPSPSPVSSSSPSYVSSDSSDSSQSFVQKRTRKKKKKKRTNCRKNSQRQKKRINARGDDGEMMKEVVFVGQVEGDICLDGMKEVDIQSLLTEDEDDPNSQGELDDHQTQTQQQIIVFEHEHQQNMGDDDCSTPTTFPEKTKRIRRNSRRPQTRRGKRDESNMNMNVDGEMSIIAVAESMDEQVCGEPTDVQRKEENAATKLLFQQNHYCPKPKPRPRPYRNVTDIYESSSTATRNTS